jgi:hypothetical protein
VRLFIRSSVPAEVVLGLRTGAVHDGSRVPSTDAVPVPLRILDHIYGTVYGSTVAVQTRDLTAVYGRCTAVRQVKFKAYI